MIKKKTKQPQVVEGEVVQVDSTPRQIKLVTARIAMQIIGNRLVVPLTNTSGRMGTYGRSAVGRVYFPIRI